MGVRGLREGAWAIVGAGGGVGRELARRVSAAGHPVALFDRDARGLEETQTLLGRRRAHAAVVDLGDDDALVGAMTRARDAVGPLVHGVSAVDARVFGRLDDTPVAEFRRAMEENYLGAVKVVKAALPHVREGASGDGRSLFLLVASVAGVQGDGATVAYAASKAGVLCLAQALREELRDTGIDVRALCPPWEGAPTGDGVSGLAARWRVGAQLTDEVVVDRALRAVREPGPLVLLVDSQSRALVTLGRLAPEMLAWVVDKVAR